MGKLDFIYLCEVDDKIKKDENIKSCLNYTGGKFKLLDQILPLFPKDINTFVDIFCGGANVGINVNANKIICNDKQSQVISLFKMLKEYDKDTVTISIDDVDKTFDRSNLAMIRWAFVDEI